MKNLRTFILRDDDIRGRAIAALASLVLDPGTPLEVVLREYRRDRSLEQNAFYWDQVVTPLADHTGDTPQDMHIILLTEVFGSREVEFNGHRHRVPRRTTTTPTKMTVKEFSDYIAQCQVIAAGMGV